MTQAEWDTWYPCIERFLKTLVHGYQAGYKVPKRMTAHDVVDEMPWVLRKFTANQYNRLVDHMLDQEGRWQNSWLVQKKHGVDKSLQDLEGPSIIRQVELPEGALS